MKVTIRILLLSLGWLSLSLGIIGLFLPLVPTTPFLIVSAYCFSKSSARLHAWLLRQPVFGPLIQEWELYGVIPLRAKIVATVLLVLMLSYPVGFSSIPLFFRVSMIAVAGIVLLFIWSRPGTRMTLEGLVREPVVKAQSSICSEKSQSELDGDFEVPSPTVELEGQRAERVH